MKRRTFVGCALGGIALSSCGFTASHKSTPRPNVLFIAIDDLNAWIGCMGKIRPGIPVARTPNIDRLAKRGILFENAHTPVPWCKPARNATLTGLSANNSGLFEHEELRDLLPNVRTLPQHFMDNGYQVFGGGKIFHDGIEGGESSWHEFHPFTRPTNQKRTTPARSGLVGLDDGDGFDWGGVEFDEKNMIDAQIAAWAESALERNYDRPFFMGVGFRYPHLPWYLPQRYLDAYPLDGISLPWVKEDDLNDIPAAGKKMAYSQPFNVVSSVESSDHRRIVEAHQWKKAVQAYLSAISFVDEQVGKVIRALDRSSASNNTVIVLWSDNGFHLGEKLHWRKFTLWDQATRVPLIISPVSAVNRGASVKSQVSLVDIYPTLIELCNLSPTVHVLDGRSLSNLLVAPGTQNLVPAFSTYGKGNDSVVLGAWRYIRYADGSTELYNHSADPYEWKNLSMLGEYAAIKSELAQYLR